MANPTRRPRRDVAGIAVVLATALAVTAPAGASVTVYPAGRLATPPQISATGTAWTQNNDRVVFAPAGGAPTVVGTALPGPVVALGDQVLEVASYTSGFSLEPRAEVVTKLKVLAGPPSGGLTSRYSCGHSGEPRCGFGDCSDTGAAPLLQASQDVFAWASCDRQTRVYLPDGTEQQFNGALVGLAKPYLLTSASPAAEVNVLTGTSAALPSAQWTAIQSDGTVIGYESGGQISPVWGSPSQPQPQPIPLRSPSLGNLVGGRFSFGTVNPGPGLSKLGVAKLDGTVVASVQQQGLVGVPAWNGSQLAWLTDACANPQIVVWDLQQSSGVPDQTLRSCPLPRFHRARVIRGRDRSRWISVGTSCPQSSSGDGCAGHVRAVLVGRFRHRVRRVTLTVPQAYAIPRGGFDQVQAALPDAVRCAVTRWNGLRLTLRPTTENASAPPARAPRLSSIPVSGLVRTGCRR